MSDTDDRADKKLPVTGEVGDEGGSFADPTLQVATFEQDLERVGTEAPAVGPGGTEHEGDAVTKPPSEAPE